MTARAAAPMTTIRSSPASRRPETAAAAARRRAFVIALAVVVLSSVSPPLLGGCHARPSSSSPSLVSLSSAAGRRRRGGGGSARSGGGGGSGGCRTVLTFRRPTPERTGRRMFGGDGEELRFNHDSVGLTNPCLHVAVPASASTTSASVDEDGNVDASSEGWWFPPPAAVSELSDGEYGGGGGGRGGGGGGEWRVLRYRRRVGCGERCYSAVRDAALEWEFRETGPGGESLGILKAPLHRSSPSPSSSSSSPAGDCRFLWRRRSEPGVRFGGNGGGGNEGRRHIAGCDVYDNVPVNDCGGIAEPLVGETARNVLQIWPSGGGGTALGSRPGRRLVTYSETKFLGGKGGGGDDDCSGGEGDTSFGSRLRRRLPRLPSLYAANPVAVVYDLVDQSGPGGATYTSTAYATLRGHLLSGEERVTVALRNGRRGSGGEGIGGPSLAGSSARFGGSAAADDDGGGAVDVEILSYSRAAPSVLGRLAWPLIGRMQDRFFRTQLDALERVAREENASGDGTNRRHGPCLLKTNNAQ